jgi:glycosyltransferase involved in cell wall biosynthesis
MKLAFICGRYSTGLHGQIDAEGLFDARALTGSESGFFNAAWGLAELGHDVTVYCDVVKELERCGRIAGARVLHVDRDIPGDYDAYVSLNEPDQFRRVVTDGFRVVQQQLNDFPYCQSGFDSFVDAYAFLSPVHRQHVLSVTPEIAHGKATWIPNSINLSFFGGEHVRAPHSTAWCSSPDRGLQHLLEIFPSIRKRVPDATLAIYYRFDPWYEQFRHESGKIGARARYIGECLSRLGRNGENGVTLVGPVANKKIARALGQTAVLPYTCDCVTFTEGFSVAILDACAAGCVPVISNADAIGDIYKDVAHVIPGKPADNRDAWVDAVCRAMTDKTWSDQIRQRASKFAQGFDRKHVAAMWEQLLQGRRNEPIPTVRTVSTVRTEERVVEITSWSPPQPQQPKVTVVLGSNRPGGIDVTLAGLAKQTYQNFEVVFVDGRYHERHAEVVAAVRESGMKQRFFHVPNHRYGDSIWGTACAGYNTGFALSTGEIVVMLLDYAYAPPAWLEKHVEHQSDPKIIMGPHEYRTISKVRTRGSDPVYRFVKEAVDVDPESAIRAVLAQRERFREISIFESRFEPHMLEQFPVEQSELKCSMPTGPVDDHQLFNTKNESFPLEAVLDINGMDENYDRGRGPGDPDLCLRLSRHGHLAGKRLPIWVVSEAKVHCLNPRWILPNLNLIVPERGRLAPPFDGRWSYVDGLAYHEGVRQDASVTRAPNPFDIRKKREEIWHWRELSQESEPVIPKNVVSDADYFRGP